MMPDCIIFDESTAMLDPKGRAEVMNIIEMLVRERDITVLTITHNMEEAVRADRVLIIDGGRIVMDGSPQEVFSQVDALHELGLAVPQVTELFHGLRQAGIDLPQGVMDEVFAAQILEKFLRKESSHAANS